MFTLYCTELRIELAETLLKQAEQQFSPRLLELFNLRLICTKPKANTKTSLLRLIESTQQPVALAGNLLSLDFPVGSLPNSALKLLIKKVQQHLPNTQQTEIVYLLLLIHAPNLAVHFIDNLSLNEQQKTYFELKLNQFEDKQRLATIINYSLAAKL